jgi:hypothetical protein
VQQYKATHGVSEKPRTGRNPALTGQAAQAALDPLIAVDSAGADSVAKELAAQGLTPHKVHKTTVIRGANKLSEEQHDPVHVVRGKPARGLGSATKAQAPVVCCGQ